MADDEATTENLLIWAIPLDESREAIEHNWRVLSSTEKDRALRFRNPLNRDRWVTAHGALRRILGRVTDSVPQRLAFASESNGKPRIVAPRSASNWHFNLSHSHAMAIVGATQVGPVGVDIEHLRGFEDMDAVARRVFCDREYRDYDVLSGASRIRAFYNGWTRKESIIKATGLGLSQALRAIDVVLKPGREAAVRSYQGDDPKLWRIYACGYDKEYTCAVAIRTRKRLKFCPVSFHGTHAANLAGADESWL